jgi:type I restriction enzyme S subunit
VIDGLKPYPKLKDSGVPWLGEVPAHWAVRKVREVARVINGFPFDAGRFSQSTGYPLIRIRDLNRARTATRYDGPFVESARVNPGDVLVGMDGDFNVGTWRGAEPALLNQRMCCIRSADPATERLLFYLLPQPLKQINEVTWSTTVKHLASGQVERIQLCLPPLPEQAAIVRFLDHADRRIRRYIRAKQKLIKLLEEQKQAIIHRAVTRGLDPNVRLKPSGVEWLGDVPEQWDVRPAKWFFREVDERSTSGNEELLSVSHLTGVTPRSQKSVTMFMAESYVGHKVCRPGDLVINTMWAWMAALGVARQVGLVSPAYGVYRPRRGSPLIGDYADLLLRTKPYVSEYVCRSTGIRSSRLRLYPEQFLRIPVVCPPEAEQRAILANVGSGTAEMAKAIAAALREIQLLHEYRTRLIADVVTGKLDVRDAAARLPDEADEPEPLDEPEALGDEPDDSAGDGLDAEPEEAEA